jgi:hypothetical protein
MTTSQLDLSVSGHLNHVMSWPEGERIDRIVDRREAAHKGTSTNKRRRQRRWR